MSWEELNKVKKSECYIAQPSSCMWQCPCYQLSVSYYYDVTTIPLVGLGGVIGAMDNVQSFIGFFMASLSHVVESLKSKDTRNLCTVALTLLLFCLAMW